MATVLAGLIYPALRIAGILGAPGRTAKTAGSIQAEAFDVLNTLIDGWNLERLTIFEEARLVFNLVASQQTYTIGPGGNFNTVRPQRIDRASIVIQYNGPQPMELPLQILTYAQWQQIVSKSVTSSIPRQVYYQPAYPLGNVNYWPLPSQVVQTILYVWQQMGAFATITDPISIPPGYLKALRYNLAADLADIYPGKQKMSARSMQIAAESKGWIKRQNIIPLDIQVDRALIDLKDAGFNVYTGEYNR